MTKGGIQCELGISKINSYQTTFVGKHAITPNKNISCNSLPENLNSQHIGYQFFRLLEQNAKTC